MDRAGGWVRDVLHGQVLGAPTPQSELFQLFEEEPGGSLPACLVAPRGPQEAVQRHTVEQLADIVPMVQVLDAPGLLGEVGVEDLLREIDAPALDELVIAVPKISLVRAPRRWGDYLRPTQAADQLVELPTIISFFFTAADCRAAHRHSGSSGSAGRWRRSSWFTSRTGYNSVSWSRIR